MKRFRFSLIICQFVLVQLHLFLFFNHMRLINWIIMWTIGYTNHSLQSRNTPASHRKPSLAGGTTPPPRLKQLSQPSSRGNPRNEQLAQYYAPGAAQNTIPTTSYVNVGTEKIPYYKSVYYIILPYIVDVAKIRFFFD